MNKKTLFRWEQDGAGGDHGTLVLWPETSREMRLVITDFATANRLGMAINGIEKDEFRKGRQSMLDEIARLKA